jgi:D-inositol-3-phosphate glycosyltransferase
MRTRSWWTRGSTASVGARVLHEERPRPRDTSSKVDDSATRERLRRVGLLWSAIGLSEPTEPFTSSGKWVAAAGMTWALARYGSASDLDIFVPIREMDECKRHLERWSISLRTGEAATAHLWPECQLPDWLATQHCDVLHDPRGVNFAQQSYVRSRLCRQLFPITGSQMGMSYSYDVPWALIPLLMAQIYPCDAVVCSTQASRQAMENRLSDIAERYSEAWERPSPSLPRLDVIPWGVDTERFAPRDQVAARRDLDLPLDRRILLCVGRLRIEDKMDLTPLLLAFDRARARASQRLLLIIAGASPGKYGHQLLEHAARLGLRQDLWMLFNLPSSNLPALYAACDVFVAPTDSPTESFGLTVVEAMASGRPVVVSDWDGYREIVVHGETGFKVRSDWADCLGELDLLAPGLEWGQEHLHVGQSVSVDVGQMADYLTCLVENGALREEIGRRARAHVEALYSWPVVVAQWEALWGELSMIARSIKREEQDRLEYLRPHYFQHFSHYATRIINDTISVRLTPRGKAVLSRKSPLFLHLWAQGFLSPNAMVAILTRLKASSWLGSILCVGELLEVVQKSTGLSRDRALMHLMWLAKYDLVSFGEDPIACDEPSPDKSEGT